MEKWGDGLTLGGRIFSRCGEGFSPNHGLQGPLDAQIHLDALNDEKDIDNSKKVA